MIQLLMPGATPQSTIAVTFFSLASASICNASSGKKEMSTTFLPALITAFNVSKPIKPGTAVTAISKVCNKEEYAAVFCRSATTVFILVDLRCRCCRFCSLTSKQVTSNAVARSSAMARPTIPAPRTAIVIQQTFLQRCPKIF